MTKPELHDLFFHHDVDPTGRYTIQNLAKYFESLAELILENCPDGKARSKAVIALKESSMWATFAVAASYPVM